MDSLAPIHDTQCFSLPYGLIGFTVHLAIYVTTWSLINLQTLSGNDLHQSWVNIRISVAGALGGSFIAFFNAYRCREHRPLLLLCIVKGSFTIMVNCMNIAKNFENMRPPLSGAWYTFMALCPPTLVLALVGMGRLAKEGWEDGRMKGVIAGFIVVWVVLTLCCREINVKEKNEADHWSDFLWSLMMEAFPFEVPIACDWVIAVSSDNLTGVLSNVERESVAIYVLYIVFTLAPMLNR
ncbi:hypothetical protein K491DRAFT_696405 [Lophiostoma macrostomum CBS 122681]|uniref:Uncharacterized protein n=1 Tax=Lophiostoma macrostomum CBS 122681 TaxID=1314788 RepID=A0A6A6SUR6_9PLEO|nr:hypothetical protein K491DRAFT_696405 [Lophiostoma macrostomum CBS 122681]